MPQLHIRYEGNSIDLPLPKMKLTEKQVRKFAADHLRIPPAKLAAFTIDRNTQTGDVTLRPQAIFG